MVLRHGIWFRFIKAYRPTKFSASKNLNYLMRPNYWHNSSNIIASQLHGLVINSTKLNSPKLAAIIFLFVFVFGFKLMKCKRYLVYRRNDSIFVSICSGHRVKHLNSSVAWIEKKYWAKSVKHKQISQNEFKCLFSLIDWDNQSKGAKITKENKQSIFNNTYDTKDMQNRWLFLWFPSEYNILWFILHVILI